MIAKLSVTSKLTGIVGNWIVRNACVFDTFSLFINFQSIFSKTIYSLPTIDLGAALHFFGEVT